MGTGFDEPGSHSPTLLAHGANPVRMTGGLATMRAATEWTLSGLGLD